MTTHVRRIGLTARGQGGLAVGLLGLALFAWLVTDRRMAGKDACLRRCRGPLQFLTHAWRDGLGGAFRMGLEHGGWCVGCCWALMAALFALGVMSIGWMVFVAALIAIEKLLPWKDSANRAIA